MILALLFAIVGNFIAWFMCVMTSTMTRKALGLQGASLLNALRGRAIWANRRNHYMRMW